MSDTMKLSITRGAPPPAAATAEGLPDTSTQQATRHNAKLLWQAVTLRVGDSGTPFTRDTRPGVLVHLNVSKLIGDMWDGYEANPFHSASTAARTAMYKYLRAASVMVCTERRAGDGSTWWVANEWQDKPFDVTGNYSERRLTPAQAGEDREPAPVEIRYTCHYPDCPQASKQMLPQGLGRHISAAHDLTYDEYKLMLTGARPWPDDDEIVGTEIYDDDGTTVVAVTDGKGNTTQVIAGDPLVAVESLVAEVKRLRALVSDSDLVEENRYLRGQLAEVLTRNEKLRQRLEAADRVLGRR